MNQKKFNCYFKDCQKNGYCNCHICKCNICTIHALRCDNCSEGFICARNGCGGVITWKSETNVGNIVKKTELIEYWCKNCIKKAGK
jgi:hypothetical protein